MFGSPPVDATATAAVAAKSTIPNSAILRTCSSLSRVTAMATRRGSTRIAVVAALAAVVAIAAIGWAGAAGSKAAAQRAAKAATVQTKKLKKLGTVLVNSKGLTLYMFVPDKQKKVTCTSKACVIVWPPLKLKNGQKPHGGRCGEEEAARERPEPKGLPRRDVQPLAALHVLPRQEARPGEGAGA